MASIIKVNDIQNTSGANIINESSNTITIGASGDTITIPSGATLNGSSATLTGFGKIGQVVYGRTTTQIQSTSTSYATTNFSANITPTSTSSKILVIADIHYQIFGNGGDADYGGNFKIVRTVSSTDTDVFSESSPTPRQHNRFSNQAYHHGSYVMQELDEPSTTSEITYTIHQKARASNVRISLSQDSAISTITLMEVLS